MTTPSSAVSVRNLVKRFGKVSALDDVTFDIPVGSVSALIGPNGAGKTTLFSVAAGILRATSGHIEVLGVDVSRAISALKGRFSLLPQDALFQGNIPILEQIVLFCRLNGLDNAAAHKAAREALDLVGLGDVMERRARQLSHGMGKRLAIAQAFLGTPEVVFLDEPTSGLDPENAANIRNLIRTYLGHRTVVISSHNLAELQELCNHVAVIHKGKLSYAGAMGGLLGAGHTLRALFNRAVDDAVVAAIAAVDGVRSVKLDAQGGVEVTFDAADTASKDALVGAILAATGALGLVPRNIQEGQRLEERFLEVTGAKSDGLGSS